MPAYWEMRIVEVEVGGALPGGPWKAWAAETFRQCDCPNCGEDGHWYQGGAYDTREEVEAYLDTYHKGWR